jgi:hypothetical protein
MTAAALLRSYSKTSLERMAKQRRLETRGQNKEALIATLAPILFDANAIRGALAALSPVERRVLDEVRVLGGDAATGLIKRRLEREGAIQPELPRGSSMLARVSALSSDLPDFEAVVGRLGAAGLVFSSMPWNYASAVDLASPGQRLFIPNGVLEHVPTVSLPIATTDPPTDVAPAHTSALLRDVYLLLTMAVQSPIPLTARGLITKRTLIRLDAQMRVPEDAAAVATENELVRLPLLRALLEDLGLLVVRAGALMATERVGAFLSKSPGDRRGQLMRAYRQTTRWCELFHVEGLHVEAAGAWRGAPQQVIAARQRVLAELVEVPVEQWITLDELVERLKRRAYELLFRRQWHSYSTNPYSSPYRDSSSNPLEWTFGPSVDEERGWDLVEGGLIRVVVGQVLHWLGVVDVGVTPDGSTAVRVTPDGARLLGDKPLSATVTAPHVVVQPNFQIFAFEPTDESVLFTLDQLADRVRAEQVVEYQLSRDAVYRAQRAGLNATAIVSFLERASSVPLPQNVRRSLEEWGALHERVTVHRGVSLLHAVNAPTLDALYADSRVAPLLGRRVAPTAALVAPEHLAALHQRLLDGDCLPALSEGPERLAQLVFAVDGDGRISFRQRLPDMAVLQAAQQVADLETDGSTRVTMHSLQRAAAQGLGADDILASLERFHDGPLPAELVLLVRRWAKHWGRGVLAAVTLLQVESAEALNDLLADPEVGPHVRRLEGAATVAIVQGAGVERVRAALQARGMELADSPLCG